MKRDDAKSCDQPLRGALLRLLWRPALWAIPFGVFFGTVFGRGLSGYVGAYFGSLIFSYCIMSSLLVANRWILPRLARTDEDSATRRRAIWLPGAVNAGAALFGSVMAAVIANFTVSPGFLGNLRSVAIFVMFMLLFTALFTGAAYAINFYRQALDRARTEQELATARRIQRAFLRTEFTVPAGFDVHAVNVSSREVSGDFYDVVAAGDGAFLVAIADVCGKGVPAALQSSLLQAALRTQARSTASAAAMVGVTNALLHECATPGQFATLFLGRVDAAGRRLSYANAGHNHPILFRRDGTRVLLDRGGIVLGVLDPTEFEEGAVALETGDRVVLYTDGISEAADDSEEQYGEERLGRLVESLPRDLPAREVTERILEDVRRFLGKREPGDDMTLMVLRVIEA